MTKALVIDCFLIGRSYKLKLNDISLHITDVHLKPDVIRFVAFQDNFQTKVEAISIT